MWLYFSHLAHGLPLLVLHKLNTLLLQAVVVEVVQATQGLAEEALVDTVLLLVSLLPQVRLTPLQ
jgi:hypothetical protein